MGIEIVLNQPDFLGGRIADIGQPLQAPGTIDGCPTLGDFDMPIAR